MNELPLTQYVYGTTRLGDPKISFENRVAIAREAIDSGLALHTSDQYGDALKVLNVALDADRMRVPTLIFKIGHNTIHEIQEQAERQLKAVGLTSMGIGQLCLGGELAEEFRTGDEEVDQLIELRDSGLISHYVLETWPWTSGIPLQALHNGTAGHVIDALIFYLNPLQRFVTNELWDWIVDHETPVVAMRTVCGGDPNRMLEPHSTAPDYLKLRAAKVIPIFNRTGLEWTDFCVRFALGFPFVRSTVGATSDSRNLRAFMDAVKAPEPLPGHIISEILDLQRRWSDDFDRLAAPWSM